jgi:phage terminase small subunit
MLSLVKNQESKEKEQENSNFFPDPPEELSFEAKQVWLKAGEYLFNQGVINDGNYDLFYSYCVLIGEARECEGILAVDGKICAGKKHPAYDMMINAMDKAKNIYSILNQKKLNIKEEEDETWGKDKGLLA